MIAHPPWKTRPDPVRTRPDAHSPSGRPRGDRDQAGLAAFVLAALGALAVAPNGASRATGQEPSALPAAVADPSGSRLATREKPFENSLGMRFVPVPIAGGPTDGKRVLFSMWDTRVQDYAAYAGEKSGVDGEWKDLEWQGVKQGPTHPVVNVSWEDAGAFCAWLTKTEQAAGKIGPREEYRLPTDHEWSCAVGIGEREEARTVPNGKTGKIPNVYPWGTTWPPPPDVANLDPGLNIDPFPFTSPVGRIAANAFGLFDMSGNVRQWSEDVTSDWSLGRILRGSAWNDAEPRFLLSSFRTSDGIGGRRISYGFRCVLADRPDPAERKPPELAITPLPSSGAIPEPPGRSTAYTVDFQTEAESGGWRPGGTWIIGKRLDRRIVALHLRSANLGETLVGKITFDGGEPLNFHGTSIDDFRGTTYKAMSQWSTSSTFAEAGTWILGGRGAERIVSIDLESSDGGETLTGSVRYYREGEFRVRATSKPSPADTQVAATTPPKPPAEPALNDGVKTSVVKLLHEQDPVELGPGYTVTLGVRLDRRVADLADVKGVRFVLDEILDHDGAALHRTRFFAVLDRNFLVPRPVLDFDHEGDHRAEATFWVAPGSGEGLGRLSGKVELLIPSRDPASVITAGFPVGRQVGNPFEQDPFDGRGRIPPTPREPGAPPSPQDQVLEAAGISFSLGQRFDGLRKEGLAIPTGGGTTLETNFEIWTIGFTMRDPNGKVALHATEFLDPRGRRIESASDGGGPGKGDRYASASFFSNPPLGTVARFFLLTEKSVVSIPFEFENIQASNQ